MTCSRTQPRLGVSCDHGHGHARLGVRTAIEEPSLGVGEAPFQVWNHTIVG
jgi:hypothetical protein